MDSIGYMTVASLGAQQEYDDQILKEIWGENFSGLTAQQAQDNCEAVYEKQGSDAYNKCYAAGLGCGKDDTCNALARKYSAALVKGYSKDFESFKRRSSNLYRLGEIGGGILGGLLDRIGGGGGEGEAGADYYPPEEKTNTGLYLLLGLVAVAGIGAIIYYQTKK